MQTSPYTPQQYNQLLFSEGQKKKDLKRKYPVFDEAAKFADSPFWKERFILMASGKAPKGFILKDGTLKCTRNKFKYSIEIPFEPQEAYLKCLDFFRKNGFMSDEEREQIHQKFEEDIQLEQSFYGKTWEQITCKKMKELFVYNYLLELRSSFGLNNNEFRDLQTVVTIGMKLGSITNANIVFSNCRITSINNLSRDINGNFVVIGPLRKRVNYSFLPDNQPRMPSLHNRLLKI